MGLDMYLSAELYLWNYRDEDKATSEAIEKILGELPKGDEGHRFSPVKSVGLEVMYWRKANAIHQWFVDNVQDGDDDCKRYCVAEETLSELIEICKKVVKIASQKGISQEEKVKKWEKLLPTQGGFFFGDTEYQDYYIEECKRTAKALEEYLASDVAKRCDFYYQSSW